MRAKGVLATNAEVIVSPFMVPELMKLLSPEWVAMFKASELSIPGSVENAAPMVSFTSVPLSQTSAPVTVIVSGPVKLPPASKIS